MSEYFSPFPMCQIIDERIIKKPKISHTNSVDPTLQLPDHILHSIFSYLTSQHLINVRLVSKTWHKNSPLYFVFNFNQSLFFSKGFSIDILQQMRNNYMECIHSSLDTSKTHLCNAENRILHIQFNDQENAYDILKLMDENNFHEMYLKFEDCRYHLPYMFQSTCLTILHLSRCTLDHPHVLFQGEGKLYSLQELKLDCVKVRKKTLSMFISKCPNIRELSLVSCFSLKSIVLPKLDHLNKFYVQFMSPFSYITNVQVIAPSLQVFHFVYRGQREDVVNMDIRACRMLREFHLDCLKFPDGIDHENFCSNFPRLVTLLMGPCEAKKTVKISSSSLKTLFLFFTRMHEDSRTRVVFAPNLSTYECVGTTFKPFLNPSDAPNLIETKIGLAYHVTKIHKPLTFINLRDRLKDFSNNIGLSLCVRDIDDDDDDSDEIMLRQGEGETLPTKVIEREQTPPLHHIKHVLLDMSKIKARYEYLMKYIMNELFWMSHPDILTLLVPSRLQPMSNDFIEELKTIQEGNCSYETMDKCWSHFLKDFQVCCVENIISVKDEVEFVFKFTWHQFH